MYIIIQRVIRPGQFEESSPIAHILNYTYCYKNALEEYQGWQVQTATGTLISQVAKD